MGRSPIFQAASTCLQRSAANSPLVRNHRNFETWMRTWSDGVDGVPLPRDFVVDSCRGQGRRGQRAGEICTKILRSQQSEFPHASDQAHSQSRKRLIRQFRTGLPLLKRRDGLGRDRRQRERDSHQLHTQRTSPCFRQPTMTDVHALHGG